MFDARIDSLLEHLPEVEELGPDEIRRLLTGAFVDIVSIRDLGADQVDGKRLADVRRLATALELEAVFHGDFSSEFTKGCAFVAAEALELVRDLSGLTDDAGDDLGTPIPAVQYACMEAGALYLISGFDANAAVAARGIDPQSIEAGNLPEAPAAAQAAESIGALLELREPRRSDDLTPPEGLRLSDRLRWEIWRRISDAVGDHVAWLLTGGDHRARDPSERLETLSKRLDEAGVDADASHLANLLGAACRATSGRALHSLSDNGDGTFAAYIKRRARRRPLLWPAAAEYAAGALTGEPRHAVVAVPTGAGKSSVAELGIAATLDQGWTLYLTPTNALASQVTRDLSSLFGDIEGIAVRGFLGGAEFTTLSEESIADVQERQVLVMTPEKCSLALRQTPESFENLGLLVMDECHLLGAQGSRGVTAELTVSAVLDKTPHVRVIMLSALLANSEEIGEWIGRATRTQSQVITTPWRPTRTLRAVMGIDTDRAEQPFQEARTILDGDPGRRRKEFEAPVNLLASYQGAWKTLDSADYAVLPGSFSVELKAERQKDGEIRAPRGGYVNQAAGRVTYQLANAGERVLTFLPKNKHYSFSVARDLPDLEPRPNLNSKPETVSALLDLTDYELGIKSLLRGLIDRGIAVHTAAMLPDEQRASELSFLSGQARAIFATSTLAQGLNLPATAVVIGGTEIGDARHLPPEVRIEKTRSDLLNAIGRAGRAYVAARSIGVVIPQKWVPITADPNPEAARERAPFLEYPDASTTVNSQIQALIRTTLNDPQVQLNGLTEEELATFTFLASNKADEGQAVLRNSFGAFREAMSDSEALDVSEVINRVGREFVESAEAPEWIVEASRIAGVGLPTTAGLLAAVNAVGETVTEDISGWRGIFVSALSRMTPQLVVPMLPKQNFERTRMAALVNMESTATDWTNAINALDSTLALWMGGTSIDEIVEAALLKDRGNPGRSSGNPLPKMITLTDKGFGFGISRLAGALAALYVVANESDEDDLPKLSDVERKALDLFPLAVRFGCDDLASIAWFRWGFRRRRIAHLLADELPPPDGLSGDNLAKWIIEARLGLMTGETEGLIGPEATQLVSALRFADRA